MEASPHNTKMNTPMITCNADTIPIVSPMCIRRFRPVGEIGWGLDGGKLIAVEVTIEDEGQAETRLDFDEDVIDVSNGVFSWSNRMLMAGPEKGPLMILPSRRWRSNRIGEEIIKHPDDLAEEGILFLGNPVRLTWSKARVLEVHRESTYLIKSGVQMGY